MQNLLKKILLIVVTFLLIQSNIRAIECNYPTAGLKITYDESSTSINHEEFTSGDFYINLLVAKWGSSSDINGSVYLPQNLYSKYKATVCPSNMYVCEYTQSSFNLPSFKNLGYGIADFLLLIDCLSGNMSKDICDDLDKNAFSLFTINEKTLYVIDEEEYQELGLEKYKDGLFWNDLDEAGAGAYDYCTGGSDKTTAKIFGNVCYFATGLVDIVGETVWDDGIEFYYKKANCQYVKYDGPYQSLNINCAKLSEKMMDYMQKIEEYDSCDSTPTCKKVDVISDIKEQEEGMKNYCKQVFQNFDYLDGQKECIDECLNLDEHIKKLKEGTDLHHDYSTTGECGFSARLVSWGLNIMKWIKYIVPVFVIIFGIFDFIKAIGADKEDEMKKSQKKFITRLIAAALIFIIPFILEFVLDKFGFTEYIDGCGVIEELE